MLSERSTDVGRIRCEGGVKETEGCGMEQDERKCCSKDEGQRQGTGMETDNVTPYVIRFKSRQGTISSGEFVFCGEKKRKRRQKKRAHTANIYLS